MGLSCAKLSKAPASCTPPHPPPPGNISWNLELAIRREQVEENEKIEVEKLEYLERNKVTPRRRYLETSV